MNRIRQTVELALAMVVAIAVAAAIRRLLVRAEERRGELASPSSETRSPALRNGHGPNGGGDERTRDQLYREAQRLDVHGRSKMNKQELKQAVEAAETGGST